MKNLVHAICKLYSAVVGAVCYLQSPFLLVVRVWWGLQISQNGWAKLHNLAHVTEFFGSLGLPAPGFTAAFVSTTELIVGILLAVGLFSRIAAFALTVDMAMAYITADREALGTVLTSDPGAFYRADPYTFLFAALLILIMGPGFISLDALLKKYLREFFPEESPLRPQARI